MNNIDEDSLAQLIMRGGIYYKVTGGSRGEILSNITAVLPAINSDTEWPQLLLQAVVEREAHISTGIENGIALPHPRIPMLKENEKPFVAVAFPHKPIDWGTPDGSEVHTIFLIVSKSPKQHLDVLSKINFLCRQETFFNLLSTQAAKEKIIAAVEEAENRWGAVFN